MKMEVESKFNVGDRVRIDIYDEVNVVDIKFNDTEINQMRHWVNRHNRGISGSVLC